MANLRRRTELLILFATLLAMSAQTAFGQVSGHFFSPGSAAKGRPGFVPKHLQMQWKRSARAPWSGQAAAPITSARVDAPVREIASGDLLQTILEEPQEGLSPAEAAQSFAADQSSPEDEAELTEVHSMALEPTIDIASNEASCDDCLDAQGWGPQVVPGLWVDHLSVFSGVQGVKNGGNRGESGSFGFHEGLNFGTAAKNIVFPPSVGLQIGFQATHSDFEGASFTREERRQIFLTTGAFRRVDHGLQGGLVFDYLWDDWYYDVQVGQVRGELSWARSPVQEFGFWFASSVEDDLGISRLNSGAASEAWETTDLYAFFYRTRMLGGGRGEGSFFAGFTGDDDAILGHQSRMPLQNGFALETDVTYVMPDEAPSAGGRQSESWNVAMNLVWYPGSLACGNCRPQHRPLFDVANNGSLILRRKN